MMSQAQVLRQYISRLMNSTDNLNPASPMSSSGQVRRQYRSRLMNSKDRHNSASRMLLLEQRRQQHISHVSTLQYNYSIGLVWPHNDIDDDNDRIMSQIDVMNDYARQKRNRKLKIILLVGKLLLKQYVAGQEGFVRDKCPIVDCWMTTNQSLAPVADALLITNFQHSSRKLYLPKPRRQIWIAWHNESPRHNRIDPVSLRGLVNWTTTYRHDSTVVIGLYGKMLPGVQATAAVTSGKGSYNYAAGKSKLVAWFVSRCNSRNQRFRYAQNE